jgi:hypothetical protein
MVSVFALSTIDREFEPRSNQTKTITLVFAVSPLSTWLSGVRAKSGWLGIRTMCPTIATYIYPQTDVSES